MKIDGGYHCGYIAYEAEADPAKARTFLLAPHMSAFGGKADSQFALTDVCFGRAPKAPTLYRRRSS